VRRRASARQDKREWLFFGEGNGKAAGGGGGGGEGGKRRRRETWRRAENGALQGIESCNGWRWRWGGQRESRGGGEERWSSAQD
jgi:hypothetical protein